METVLLECPMFAISQSTENDTLSKGITYFWFRSLVLGLVLSGKDVCLSCRVWGKT